MRKLDRLQQELDRVTSHPTCEDYTPAECSELVARVLRELKVLQMSDDMDQLDFHLEELEEA